MQFNLGLHCWLKPVYFQLRSTTAPVSLFSVEKHNSTPGNDPIRSVLCPGLGTAVGRMPAERCAYQVTTQIVFFFNCIEVLNGIIVGMESRNGVPSENHQSWLDDHIAVSISLQSFIIPPLYCFHVVHPSIHPHLRPCICAFVCDVLVFP